MVFQRRKNASQQEIPTSDKSYYFVLFFIVIPEFLYHLLVEKSVININIKIFKIHVVLH